MKNKNKVIKVGNVILLTLSSICGGYGAGNVGRDEVDPELERAMRLSRESGSLQEEANARLATEKSLEDRDRSSIANDLNSILDIQTNLSRENVTRAEIQDYISELIRILVEKSYKSKKFPRKISEILESLAQIETLDNARYMKDTLKGRVNEIVSLCTDDKYNLD